ncbi:MAG: hypothetical protein GF329_21685 [Candidatus Lokiarchaeota archaeon]|nr:hypothetical protein [Candidatus Lokiarchaeota archaeon]
MQYEDQIIEGITDTKSNIWGESQKKEREINPSALGQTYFSFRNRIRIFGQFLFTIAWRFIITGIILNVFTILWSELIGEIPAINLWFLFGILSSILGILIFIIPQLSIHRYLGNAKKKITRSMIDFRERIIQAFIGSFYLDKNISVSIDKELEIRKPLRKDISVLNEYIKKLNKAGAWTYDFPKISELIIGIIVAIVPLFVQYWLGM